MPIVQVPSDRNHDDQLICIVCSQPLPLAEATAGSTTADNQQVFAHESHRINRAEWLFCWLQFENREHRTALSLAGAAR